MRDSDLCPASYNKQCRDFVCDQSGLRGRPRSLTIHEDDDTERLLWTVSGQAFVQYPCDCNRAPTVRTGTNGEHVLETRLARSNCNCSANLEVKNCGVTGDSNNTNIVEVRDGIYVYRKACSNPGCSDCAGASGCFTSELASDVMNIMVTCDVGVHGLDGFQVSAAFRINVQRSPPVTLVLNGGNNTVTLTEDSVLQTVVKEFSWSDPAGDSTPDLDLRQTASATTGVNLFAIDTADSSVKLVGDLTQEHSATYTLTICASNRRRSSCHTFLVVVEIDECSRHPCQNDAICENDDQTFRCTCLAGWRGTICDDPDVDDETPAPPVATIPDLQQEVAVLHDRVESLQEQVTSLTVIINRLAECCQSNPGTGTTGTPPTARPPVPPEGNWTSCHAIDSLGNVPGLHEYCNTICNHNPPYCPQTHCECEGEETVRSQCVATNEQAAVPGMDAWCDINCNTYPFNCPDNMCSCEGGDE